MTPEQSNLVAAFARDLAATVRRILGLTGPAEPGWYRPSQLSAAQREAIIRGCLPLIGRFAEQARPFANS